jgi:hypothetical protein
VWCVLCVVGVFVVLAALADAALRAAWQLLKKLEQTGFYDTGPDTTPRKVTSKKWGFCFFFHPPHFRFEGVTTFNVLFWLSEFDLSPVPWYLAC